MSEIEVLRSAVEALTKRLSDLEDIVSLSQLVARYGPAVDSGSADAAAALWTEDGVFRAVGAMDMHGHVEIAGMVRHEGHQSLILNGCGHVLTAPAVELHGDTATGRNYAMNIRWDEESQRFWVARVSANTWRWERTPEGWRTVERVNANLDGSEEPRRMLAPES
jgi:hypothetical protein